jgi:hypothetical protein
VSLDCQFLKLGFIRQVWIIFGNIYIEYLRSLISGSDIERFFEGDRFFK